jgi:hypothetical protein
MLHSGKDIYLVNEYKNKLIFKVDLCNQMRY